MIQVVHSLGDSPVYTIPTFQHSHDLVIIVAFLQLIYQGIILVSGAPLNTVFLLLKCNQCWVSYSKKVIDY